MILIFTLVKSKSCNEKLILNEKIQIQMIYIQNKNHYFDS